MLSDNVSAQKKRRKEKKRKEEKRKRREMKQTKHELRAEASLEETTLLFAGTISPMICPADGPTEG